MKPIAIILLLLSPQVYADGSVGCGLGTVVLKKNSILSALLRTTTNHSFSSQLFGITSGTSGCSRHSIVKTQMAPLYYAEANSDNLKAHMSIGKGEYLMAFGQSFGCPQSLQDHVNKLWRTNSQQIFDGDPNPKTIVDRAAKILQNDQKTALKCQNAFI